MNDRQPMGKVEARAVRVTVEVTTNLPQETTWNPLKEDFEYSGKCFCNISGVIDDCEVELDFMMKGDFGGAQSYVIPAKHYFHGGGNQNIPIKIRADFAEARCHIIAFGIAGADRSESATPQDKEKYQKIIGRGRLCRFDIIDFREVGGCSRLVGR